MKNFYIDVGDRTVELYTLVKITNEEYSRLVELAGTEFFLKYESDIGDKDPNIPIISKPKTKWFSNKYDITERWSAATYVAIPDGYQFQ